MSNISRVSCCDNIYPNRVLHFILIRQWKSSPKGQSMNHLWLQIAVHTFVTARYLALKSAISSLKSIVFIIAARITLWRNVLRQEYASILTLHAPCDAQRRTACAAWEKRARVQREGYIIKLLPAPGRRTGLWTRKDETEAHMKIIWRRSGPHYSLNLAARSQNGHCRYWWFKKWMWRGFALQRWEGGFCKSDQESELILLVWIYKFT